MKQKFTASVWHENELVIAQCLEVDVASQGNIEEIALTNLAEALTFHFDGPTPTMPLRIRTIEVDIRTTFSLRA